MGKLSKSFVLKLTSAIAVDGDVMRAGSLVEVDEATARNLLHRGKAELATESDGGELGQGKEVDLSRLNKAQLLAHAASVNVEVSEAMSKAEIQAAIEAADQDE